MNRPIAFVVGAGNYIGTAVARRFASGGYTVCMARRNGDRLQPVVDAIKQNGGEAFGFSMDARDAWTFELDLRPFAEKF